MLILKSTIQAKKVTGRDNVCTFQFVENKEDGSLDFIEVRMPVGFQHEGYKQGTEIEMPVTVSSLMGRTVYKAAGVPLGHKSGK